MDTSAARVWLILWKAYESLHAYAVNDIESLQMCLSDFAILEALLHKGPLPMNDIARRVSLTAGSVTTAIDRLEKRSLVRRQSSDEDRRTRLITLTAEGRKLIKAAFSQHAQALETVAAPLTKKEREQLIALLKRFGRSAEARLMALRESRK
jgi:MarR family 2-MHQ and catechol resistance regulon transcriptional repressor